MDISNNVPLPKKRGRKPKNQSLNGEPTKPVEKPPPKKKEVENLKEEKLYHYQKH